MPIAMAAAIAVKVAFDIIPFFVAPDANQPQLNPAGHYQLQVDVVK